ncbi:MAG TPA: hypothetical protein VK629_10760 [Steroidobacteraceae bacterium]|nr:hypothetical protein [Steroidobacteraceae bacterium]
MNTTTPPTHDNARDRYRPHCERCVKREVLRLRRQELSARDVAVALRLSVSAVVSVLIEVGEVQG